MDFWFQTSSLRITNCSDFLKSKASSSKLDWKIYSGNSSLAVENHGQIKINIKKVFKVKVTFLQELSYLQTLHLNTLMQSTPQLEKSVLQNLISRVSPNRMKVLRRSTLQTVLIKWEVLYNVKLNRFQIKLAQTRIFHYKIRHL